MSEKQPKICVECAHFRQSGHAFSCTFYEKSVLDLVTGKSFNSGTVGCYGERILSNGCDVSGKHFSPRPPKPSLWRRIFGGGK